MGQEGLKDKDGLKGQRGGVLGMLGLEGLGHRRGTNIRETNARLGVGMGRSRPNFEGTGPGFK